MAAPFNLVIGHLRRVLPAAVSLPLWLLSSSGRSQSPSESHSSDSGFVTRLKAAFLLKTLNARLLSEASATSALERWCATYDLAVPPKIIAERVPHVEKKPTEEQRGELLVTQSDTVRYRRVKLLCGTLVLSEADNWYVPGRLTPEMNKLLETDRHAIRACRAEPGFSAPHNFSEGAVVPPATGVGDDVACSNPRDG